MSPGSRLTDKDDLMSAKTFAPSLMGMSILNVQEDLSVLNRYFDHLHFDIMDGHYCSNFSLTPGILKAIRPLTDSYIDVHIMATDPDDFIIDTVIDSGADCISLHPETVWEAQYRTVNKIHEKGRDAGFVLNPSMPLEMIEHILGRIDLLTIMTVDIGFAGQQFIMEMFGKIEKADRIRKEKQYSYKIQIDGHCTADTYKELFDKGADILVVGGTGLFSLNDDLELACKEFFNRNGSLMRI